VGNPQEHPSNHLTLITYLLIWYSDWATGGISELARAGKQWINLWDLELKRMIDVEHPLASIGQERAGWGCMKYLRF
jgi:hypothetical protein